MNSLIIPVYKNAENISPLLAALVELDLQIANLEVIFVVDGSPDSSAGLLTQLLPGSGLRSQLLLLSRNFGSYAAIRSGLIAARGTRFAVMAADLQEPPELVRNFFEALENEQVDIVIATRESRTDPLLSKLTSNIFWKLYTKFVVPEMPQGGVDVFGCNKIFRDHLLQLDESHSSLVALLFWMGFRRKIIFYTRLARQHGKSAWSFKKKYIYFKDSIFSFTDLPIKLLTWVGVLGILFSVMMALTVLSARLTGWVNVPGYTATVLTIIFFGALNLFGLGIIGTYAWRTYENTKHRPSALVMAQFDFAPLKQNRQDVS
ncbi:MAG: glycosyltransferase family 2 protein [Pseudomonadota bacterium]